MRATVGFIDTRTNYSIFDLPAIFEIRKRLKNPTGLLPTSESEQALSVFSIDVLPLPTV